MIPVDTTRGICTLASALVGRKLVKSAARAAPSAPLAKAKPPAQAARASRSASKAGGRKATSKGRKRSKSPTMRGPSFGTKGRLGVRSGAPKRIEEVLDLYIV